jgi:hypothetical protein
VTHTYEIAHVRSGMRSGSGVVRTASKRRGGENDRRRRESGGRVAADADAEDDHGIAQKGTPGIHPAGISATTRVGTRTRLAFCIWWLRKCG